MEITTNERRKISSRAGRAASARSRSREAARAPKPSRADSRADNRTQTLPKSRRPNSISPALPPLESITAVTDITAFLRAGVPAELTRAALRRAWTADPAIRDFVGLAENAWDFTDPNAMPGFGPLESTDEVRRMIAQIVGEIGEAADAASPSERAANRSCRQFATMVERDRHAPR